MASSSQKVGAVIFLHGSGDTGAGFRQWIGRESFVEALRRKGVRTEFPSATPIAYSLTGARDSVWFDRVGGMAPSNPEQTDSVERSATQINALINKLVAEDIPSEKIAVGGFSMGGGMAIQAALRSQHTLAGIFTMSSYLCDDAAIYKRLETRGNSDEGESVSLRDLPPIWMAHGEKDDFVLPGWGQATSQRLKALRLDVKFTTYPGLHHEFNASELEDLNEWLSPLVL